MSGPAVGGGAGMAASAVGGAGAVPTEPGFDVCIAMDFGTHGSEIAIGFPKPGAFDLFSAAKDVAGPGTSKEPSAVLLDAADLKLRAFGDAAKREFVSICDNPAVAAPALFACEFKMLLAPPKSGATRAFDISKIPVGMDHSSNETVNLDLVVLLARTLQGLRDRAFVWLRERGSKPETMRIKYVITVPAIWDEPGKAVMRSAAFSAGLIDKEDSKALLLALEPECAALAAIADITDEERAAVAKPGASTLIVDAGGGTVDIVMDEIVDVKPWQLAEVREADGGPWGATYVDKTFIAFLQDLLGVAVVDGSELGPRIDKIDKSTKMKLMQAWEIEKRAFASAAADAITSISVRLVEFVDAVQNFEETFKATDIARLVAEWNARAIAKGKIHSIEEGLTWTPRSKTLTIPGNIVASFFEETVANTADKVTDILQELADKRLALPTRLCLVGGYANCLTLQNRVRAAAAAFDVKVILPKEPSSAVVKGAVLFGLQPRVITERVVRYSYAYLGAERFNPEVHDDKNVIVGSDGRKRCLVLFPFVQQGQKVKVGHNATKENLVPINDTQETVDFELFAIKAPIPNPGDRADDKVPRCVVAEEGVDTGMNQAFSREKCRVAELKVVIGGVGRPRDERKISLQMSFGETEVTATSKSMVTGEVRACMLKY